MKYSKTCDHCGHQDTAYTFSLNVGKIKSLRKLVDKYEITRSAVALGYLNLSTSQFTNFCHLQYFDLAKHIPEGWVPTTTGIKFIHGEVGVKTPVAMMNSKILSDEHEAWATHPGKRTKAFIFDIDETAYKQRSEYARERVQTNLFGN